MWYRIGETSDFFPQKDPCKWQWYYRIKYHPMVWSKIIRCLHIERKDPAEWKGTKGLVRFYIESTGFGISELSLVFKQYYPNDHVRGIDRITDSLGFALFDIKSEKDIETFFCFLNAINKKEGFELITNTLLDEFKNLIDWLQLNINYQPGFQHLISKKAPTHSHPQKLANLLNKKNYTLSEYKKLLAKGEDPNQHDKMLEMPIIFLLILGNKIEELKLLLIYKANPYLRSGDKYDSGLEYAIRLERKECYNIIDASQTRPERPLIKVTRSQFHHLTESSFEYENGITIQTKCKKTAEIKMGTKEWDDLFKLYQQEFKNQSEKDFYDEVKGEEKYIDLVYANHQLIGFFLSRILFDKGNNAIIIYSMYALMDAAYKYTKLAPIIDFRLGFAMQLLFPTTTIFFIGLAGSDDGHRMMASNGDYFPKYNPCNAEKFVKNILPNIEPDCELKSDKEIGYWVVDTVSVKSKEADDPNNRSFFIEYLLGYGKNPITEIRSAVCYFVISAFGLIKLNELALRLSINLSEQIAGMVKCMMILMNQRNLDIGKNPFVNIKFLFWKGQRVTDNNSEDIFNECKLRLMISKL